MKCTSCSVEAIEFEAALFNSSFLLVFRISVIGSLVEYSDSVDDKSVNEKKVEVNKESEMLEEI